VTDDHRDTAVLDENGAADAVETVERERDSLRTGARAALGITGEENSSPPPLRQTLRESGVGWYPLLALGVLVIVDQFQGHAFSVLGPDVARSLGMSKAAVGAAVSLKLAALSLATLPMAAYVQNRPRRHTVSIVTAFAWSIITLSTGFVTGFAGLLAVLLLDGASTGSTTAVHQPLLMDSYPPQARVRSFSYYQGANSFGNVLAPLMIALLTGVFAFTWRGVFLAMGVVSIGAAFFALRLRDPGFGRWDTGRVRDLVRDGSLTDRGSEIEEETKLGFFEIVRRLLMIPTQRKILTAFGVLGVMIVPFNTFFFFFLDERWGLGPEERSLFDAYLAAVAVVVLLLFARRGEQLFRRDPAKLIRATSMLIVLTLVLVILGAVTPWFIPMALIFGVSFSLVAALTPSFYVALLAIVPPPMRPHASALAGIYLGLIGGLAGTLLLGSVDRRFGITGALIAVSVPGLIGALVLRSAAKTINDDIDRMIEEVVEEEEVKKLTSKGTHLPLLACRHIDFSYGQVQVLFDVSFSVDDGEMVALLGTNGAGKSTLLRVISGLGLPSRGSVRLYGADITFLDAERRLNLGISQIPGRSIFGPLSVAENLRLLSYSHKRDAKSIEEGIEASFDAFPVLAERRDQPAQTLSGGEQQMLALSKALILKPRLLLIDELSLGLAPAVVSSLLDTVRKINQQGTAVVLVEQSVNIALSLVHHAYFMERGQIRFDGRSEDLIGREDLLRSVFLHGAAAATETSSGAS
jgi:ABC-type branched-subunit amino acid transport system ATPase component/MFS family permease